MVFIIRITVIKFEMKKKHGIPIYFKKILPNYYTYLTIKYILVKL